MTQKLVQVSRPIPILITRPKKCPNRDRYWYHSPWYRCFRYDTDIPVRLSLVYVNNPQKKNFLVLLMSYFLSVVAPIEKFCQRICLILTCCLVAFHPIHCPDWCLGRRWTSSHFCTSKSWTHTLGLRQLRRYWDALSRRKPWAFFPHPLRCCHFLHKGSPQ